MIKRNISLFLCGIFSIFLFTGFQVNANTSNHLQDNKFSSSIYMYDDSIDQLMHEVNDEYSQVEPSN